MTALPPSAVWPQSRHLEQQSRSVPSSRLAALAALGLAFVAHASFAFWGATVPVEQAGGNTALAAQGNSFANMATGVQTPKPAVDAQQAQEPEKPAPERPQTPVASLPSAAEKVTPIKPVPNQRPKVQTPASSAEATLAAQGDIPLLAAKSPETTDPVAKPIRQLQAQAPPAQTSGPEDVLQVEALSPQMETVQKKPVHLSQPDPVKARPPEPQSPQVERSLRPPERPQTPAPEPVLQAQRKPAPKTVPKTASKPQGNGEVNATRGVAQSSRQKSGGQAQNTAGQAKVQGSAAASNYAGLVMRRIQRANRRAAVKGVAMVRFSVTASGALAGVSIARSSGSGKLDGVALAQVRRAAPFPPPPAGARTTFTVRIKGN